MQTFEIPADESAPQTVRAGAPVSAGWLVRRAVLWALCVGLGVAGSCMLYMAASKAEGDKPQPVAPNAAPSVPLKT